MQETINIGSDKILDCLNSAVIRTDANGNILSYNKTANRYIFKNKSNNIRQIIHRKSINNFDRYFQSLAWRESLSFELRIDNATDGFVWCNLRAARLDNEQIVFQIWDITRRKQIEEYFMASEKKFRSLFGFSNDGIVFIDSKNKVVEWNKSMENISGWKSDEAVGNTISNIFKKLFTKNSKLQKIMKKIENFATIEDEDLVSAEINIDSKPSKILQLSFFSITGDNSYGMIARDVTKIKEAEKSLKKMNKKLEQRVEEELQKREQQQQLLMQKSKLESLGKLAAGIAHEINQPLAGISMGLENLLLHIKSGEVSQNYIQQKSDDIFENIYRIRHTIEHVRTFSRHQKSGKMELVDVNLSIENAASMLKTQLCSHNILLKLELQTTLPKIRANRFELEQVFVNLISNARDAIDIKKCNEGKIKIKTYSTVNNINIIVEDNGIGISKGNIDKIFDPFFTTKQEENGTGLGLSIVYGILQKINGNIKVDSIQNQYSKFFIEIEKGKLI